MKSRTQFLKENGFTDLRFTNEEVEMISKE